MKKVICILTGIVLTTTLMIGCSKTTSDNAQTDQNTQNASTEGGTAHKNNFQAPDLEGEVSSIDGNKITLKVINVPQKSEVENGEKTDKSGDQKSSQDNNKDGKESMKQGKRQVEYTGETKDITVDDGIKIITMSMGKQDSESKTLAVSDIKVGDTLLITYSDKDKETISQIAVRQVPDQNGKESVNK